MPRVPQPRVASVGLAAPQVRPLSSGDGNLGGALQQAAGGLARIALEEREKADTVRLLDFQNQLDGLDHDLVVNGALTRQGKDALPVYDETLKAYDNATSEMVSGLSGERQKAAANALVARRRGQIGNTLEAHTAREMERYTLEVSRASEQSAGDMAISYATDPSRREEAITAGERAILASGKTMGQAPEVIDARLQSFRSTVHQGVIDKLLVADQDQAAQEYYKEYKGQISGSQQARVEAALENSSTTRQALAAADRIFTSGVDRTKAREEIAAIDDPKVRQQAQRELNQRYTEQDADARARENALFESYSDRQAQGVSLSTLQKEPGWLDLDHNSRQALIAADEQRQKRLRGDDIVSNVVKMTEFDLLPPEQMAKVNPLKDLRPYLNTADYEQRVQRVAAARQYIATGKDESGVLGEGLSFNERALTTARTAGIIPTDGAPGTWSESQRSAFDQFRNQFELALQSATAAKGSKLNTKEKQEVADRFTISVNLDRSMWRDTHVPGLTLPDDDVARAYIPATQVGDAGQEAIARRIIAAGGVASTRKIERIAAVIALNSIGRLDDLAAQERILSIAQEPVE